MKLTLIQHRPLAYLAETEAGVAATVQVAYAAGIDNPTARRLLAGLAKFGLAAPVSGSARIYLYRITPAGRKALEP